MRNFCGLEMNSPATSERTAARMAESVRSITAREMALLPNGRDSDALWESGTMSVRPMLWR